LFEVISEEEEEFDEPLRGFLWEENISTPSDNCTILPSLNGSWPLPGTGGEVEAHLRLPAP
jgi:hypothetical protein